MSEHPIEGLMLTAMNSIKDMINVNTIIGDPIHVADNIVIIPISKVSFGFAAGGSEFRGETIDECNRKNKNESIQCRLPFGGGAGSGISVNPVAFLVVQQNIIKLLPVEHSTALDKILDYVPDLIEKTNCMMNKKLQEKEDITNNIINNMKNKVEEKCEEIKEEIKNKINTSEEIEEEMEIEINLEDNIE